VCWEDHGAARSKVWVCGRSLARVAVSNSAWGHGFAGVVCCQVEVSADNSSRGALPSVVCPNDCDREALIMRRPCPTRRFCAMVKKVCWVYSAIDVLDMISVWGCILRFFGLLRKFRPSEVTRTRQGMY